MKRIIKGKHFIIGVLVSAFIFGGSAAIASGVIANHTAPKKYVDNGIVAYLEPGFFVVTGNHNFENTAGA